MGTDPATTPCRYRIWPSVGREVDAVVTRSLPAFGALWTRIYTVVVSLTFDAVGAVVGGVARVTRVGYRPPHRGEDVPSLLCRSVVVSDVSDGQFDGLDDRLGVGVVVVYASQVDQCGERHVSAVHVMPPLAFRDRALDDQALAP